MEHKVLGGNGANFQNNLPQSSFNFGNSAFGKAIEKQTPQLGVQKQDNQNISVKTSPTTAVTTTKSYLRINSMNVVSGAPTGIITLKDLTDTTTYAQINATIGRTQMAIYTVPAGYTFYLSRIDAYTSANGYSADFISYRNLSTTSNGVSSLSQQAPFTNTYHAQRVMPRPFTEKTDIQLQIKGSAVGTTQFINISAEGYLIANSVDAGST